MYYCHKCKKIYNGENTCAVLIEEEIDAIRRTSRLSVCPDCLREITNEFIMTSKEEMPVQPEEKGDKN